MKTWKQVFGTIEGRIALTQSAVIDLDDRCELEVNQAFINNGRLKTGGTFCEVRVTVSDLEPLAQWLEKVGSIEVACDMLRNGRPKK